MAVSHYKASSLNAVIDYNRLHVIGPTEDVMALESLENKICAFGWGCVMVDGHDIISTLAGFNVRSNHTGVPFATICRTVKGKGVSFMKNCTDWHSKTITTEKRDASLAELDKSMNAF